MKIEMEQAFTTLKYRTLFLFGLRDMEYTTYKQLLLFSPFNSNFDTFPSSYKQLTQEAENP